MEGLSDFTEQQFNLITLLENAKVEIQNKGVHALNQLDFSIVTKSYTEKYIEQCEEAFDRILFSLSKRE
ncbi:MAG: hypothetical protein J6H22_06445 [Pseudobutyrivibrio sp.]|nr:hypothetical protein [Pseudobutyrivibrio sp.]